LQQPGITLPIYIESIGIGETFGHGAGQMTDSLAVYDLLLTLRSTTANETTDNILGSLTVLFESASNQNAGTLESVVNAVGQLFVGGDWQNITGEQWDDRNVLYEKIQLIKDDGWYVQYENSVGFLDISSHESASIIQGNANVSIAYRYALKNLMPFALTGFDIGTLYQQHNFNGELDLYDPVDAPNGMTEQYIKDRAAFLELKLDLAIKDAVVREGVNKTYIDIATKYTATTQATDSTARNEKPQYIFGDDKDNHGANAIQGGNKADHLYGGAGKDALYGGHGEDYIEGNAGNDYLDGTSPGESGSQREDDGVKDTLLGGEGLDTYVVGDKDVIEDSDGYGYVIFGGKHLVGGFDTNGDGTYVSLDSNFTYQLDADNTLTVTEVANGAAFTINNFDIDNQNFDIKLIDTYQPSIVPAGVIYGDEDGPTEDTLSGGTGDDEIHGGELNDNLYGEPDGNNGGHDLLYGEAGDDYLLGLWGGDHLYGGTGQDILLADGGGIYYDTSTGLFTDVLEGGEGDDILIGAGGDDELYATSKNDLEYIFNSDSATATNEHEFLYGANGNDLIVGSMGQDLLAGGRQNDILIGGAGNDYLLGDYTAKTLDARWNVFDFGDGELYSSFVDTLDPDLLAPAGNDTIYGGGGRDWIDAGNGDDIVFGGNDNDEIYGRDGNDVIHGGGEADKMDGGDGDDLYFVDDAGDQVIEGYDEGIDSIISEVEFALGNNVEHLTLTGSTDINGTGNGLKNNIQGNAGNNLLEGHAGNDYLSGGAGQDTLNGGTGDDFLVGGSGSDTYQYQSGDGYDVIEESAGEQDILNLGNISLDDVIIDRNGNDLRINIDAHDAISIRNWYSSEASQIENIQLSDVTLSAAQSQKRVDAPRVINAITGLTATEDGLFTYTIPDDVFSDPNGTAALNIMVSQANGDPLPGWLSYDAASRTFSGTPDNDQVGELALNVTAVDEEGLVTNHRFSLQVENTNDAPVLVNPVGSLVVNEDSYFSLNLPENVFSDVDIDDVLTYTAVQSNQAPLPEWLNLNSSTGMLTGIPENNDVGSLNIELTATDASGMQVSDTFNLTIHNVNDKPVISAPDNVVVDLDSGNETINILASVNDVDSLILQVNLQVNNGTISLLDDTGLTFITGDGQEDDYMTFTGSQQAVNSAVSGISYRVGNSYIIDSGAVQPNNPYENGIQVRDLDGTNGVVIPGLHQIDGFGKDVSGIGDINGDGYSDVIIAAPVLGFTNDSSVNHDGHVHVILGTSAGFPASLDLSTHDGVSGFTISLAGSPGLSSSMHVSDAGDFNGDGYDDFMVSNAGGVYVVLGKETGFTADLNLSTMTTSEGFKLNFTNNAGETSFSSAGDINNDGYDDLIIGIGKEFGNNESSGQGYVVYGNSRIRSNEYDLSKLSSRGSYGGGLSGFKFMGENPGDLLGRSVAGSGDVNGDGYDDLILSAPGASINGESSTGKVYIVFGKSEKFSSTVDLSLLNGTNGYRIDGATQGSAGFSVNGAGDVNGDGLNDLIIGAPWAEVDGLGNTGQSYIVFGNTTNSSVMSLSSLDGNNGFSMQGAIVDSRSGYSVSSAGDFNGDGYGDIIVGERNTYFNHYASNSYIVFGKDDGFESAVDLSLLDGYDGIRLNGFGELGASVSGAGDVNGDGFDDVIIGAPKFIYSGDSWVTGESYILFGAPSPNRVTTEAQDDILTITVNDLYSDVPGIDTHTVSIDTRNINDAPEVNGTLLDQTIIEGDIFSYTLAQGTFSDSDVGDQLQVTAQSESGDALAEWLSFNASTLTLNGTPGDGDVGIESIVVTATDLSGELVSTGFSLQVLDKDPISAGGTSGDDIMFGGVQEDTLRGGGGNDTLYGFSGDDVLKGDSGNDRLSGGAGNDVLNGGRHDDTYLFGYGDDQDIITDSNGNDQLLFADGINPGDVWLSQVGDDLRVNLLDSNDQITIDNWFKGTSSGNQIEQFQTDDGLILLNNQVDQLIQAMAVFNPSASGDFNPSQGLRDEMEMTITASWQAA
jgi:Ca2+-binding RTX toxin-like protein